MTVERVETTPTQQRPRGEDLRRAFVDSAGAGGALFPLGLAFGMLMAQAGFEWWWATLFTAFIYAGSLEFLLVGLVAAMAPLAQIALTSLLVNIRHVFYALSFPLHRVRSPWGRAYSTFALTDEAYAITTARPAGEWTQARILWIQVLCHGYWILGGTLGALGGGALGITLPGLEFTLTALFVVLAIEAFRVRGDIPTPLIALVSGILAILISRENMLPIAMSLLTLGLLGRYAWSRRPSARARRDPLAEALDLEGGMDPAQAAGPAGPSGPDAGLPEPLPPEDRHRA